MSAVSRTAALSSRPASANFDILTIELDEDAEAVAQAFSARAATSNTPSRRIPGAREAGDNSLSRTIGSTRSNGNFPLIDMERAWAIQPPAGSSITVAVVDTGVAYTNATMRFHAGAFREDSDGFTEPPNGVARSIRHSVISRCRFVAATELGPASRFVAPHDFIWDDATPLDFDGHGTHVSGTIAS